MLTTDSSEATIILLDYLGKLRKSLDTPELLGILNEDDVADLYAEALKHIDQNRLLVSRPALYYTLKAIDERLTTVEIRIDDLAFSSIIDALMLYLIGEQLNDVVRILASFLPGELAEEYAEMLHEEAVLLSGGNNLRDTADCDIPTQLPKIELAVMDNSKPESTNTSSESTSEIDSGNAEGAPSPSLGIKVLNPLQVAMQFAVEELQLLLDSENSIPESEVLGEIFESHLDHLAFVAESLADENFLYALGLERSWIKEVIGEPGLLSKNILSEMLDRLRGLSVVGISADSEPSDVIPPIPQHSPPSDALKFADERLGMLHEELCYFDEQLNTQAVIITSAETDFESLFAYVAKYSDVMERLVKAGEALGLHGLKRVCHFVIENVNLLPTVSPTERLEVRPLLQRWPQMVKHYLSDPTDESALMGLIDLMQEKAWPARFDGLDGRDLYAELSSGADDDSELGKEEVRPTRVQPDDVSLEIGADISPQLLDAFFLESPDVAAQFNQIIATLATSANPLEGMRAAQRLSHTLKGSANLVGIKGIANLAHHIEDIFDTLSRRDMAPSASLISVLQEAADCLESMLDAVAGLDSSPTDSAEVLQRVIDIANLIYKGDYDPASDLSLTTGDSASASTAVAPESVSAISVESTAQTADTLRIPTAMVDAMFRLVEEVTISLAQIQERVNRIRNHSEMLHQHERTLQMRRFDMENLVDVRSIATMQKRLHKQSRGDDQFDPLEMDQYDKLYGATHSYIEAVADTREISNTIHNELLELDGLMLRQSRLNKELQHLVATIRMVPISNISSRLHRAVRQAARATGKSAELVIAHHNLMMDGDVLNKLVDPLLHILRNAVDHGMPEPGESSDSGLINVTFTQEGNNVVIRCSDNGKGLDYTRIHEVAVERGILPPEQEPTREELVRLIMSPTFTTRSSATHVSGRGIGLDAVFTAVTELKGSIAVHDVVPHGTEFVIHLPLSLVTTHSLVVQAGGKVYAIPTTILSQILPAGSGTIIYGEGGTTIQLEQGEYPLKTLTSLVRGEVSLPSESNPILLIDQGITPIAIAVDLLLNSFELVIKRLGRFVPRVQGVVGVSVLGDGTLIPVLDIPGLLAGELDRANALDFAAQRGSVDLATHPSLHKQQVLIVDDSLSARNLLSQLLEDSGYLVLSARDGVEAVEILQRAKPLLVLSDLEMPRMDGIELTRHIRSNKELRELPVVMITSRSQKKHRDVAGEAGVNAYLTKPFEDDELIDLVTSLV